MRILLRQLGRCGQGAAAALLVAACAAVGPDYRAPVVALPASYAEADGQPAGTDAAIERAWWQAFGDATLDGLVATALQDSWDLRLAMARVEEADAVLAQAHAALRPEVAAGASASRARLSEIAAFPVPASVAAAHSDFQGQLSSSFELDFWGRLRRADEAARAAALATRYGRATVELDLVAALVNQYLVLRSLDAQIGVSVASQANREDSARIARERFRAGLAPELELRQAEGAVAALQAQIADLQQQRAVALHQLALLTGKPGLALEAGDLAALPVPPMPPAGLPSDLLAARPDILQAEATLIAANARIGVARAALFPSVTLTGTLGSESEAFARLLSAPATLWSLVPRVDLPIFDSGRRQAVVDQGTAQQKQALAAYQQAIQAGFAEVADALSGVRHRAEQETALASQRAAAERSLQLAKQRYQAGYSPFLEVLDAQRTVNDATLSFLRNRADRLVTAVQLFKALGGGWNARTAQGAPAAGG